MLWKMENIKQDEEDQVCRSWRSQVEILNMLSKDLREDGRVGHAVTMKKAIPDRGKEPVQKW